MFGQQLGGFKDLKHEMGDVKHELGVVREDMTSLKGEVVVLKQESERGESYHRHRRRREVPITRGVGRKAHYSSEEEPQYFRPPPRGHRYGHRHRDDEYYRQPRCHVKEEEYEEPLKRAKHNIPEFHGKLDPEAYLEWLSRVEKIYALHRYTERDKILLVITEFRGYADTWWSKLMTGKRDRMEGELETWGELTSLMRATFVPSSYHSKLLGDFQEL